MPQRRTEIKEIIRIILYFITYIIIPTIEPAVVLANARLVVLGQLGVLGKGHEETESHHRQDGQGIPQATHPIPHSLLLEIEQEIKAAIGQEDEG